MLIKMWITRPYPTKNAYLSIQMSASCRFSLPAERRSKAYPLPQGGSPIAVPPQAGPTATAAGRGHLSVSQSGAFPNCVTRFRGGALRHAKFPKTSYKVQLLDALKHGRCVGQNHSRGRGLIFLSKKVLVLFWQNVNVLSVKSYFAL